MSAMGRKWTFGRIIETEALRLRRRFERGRQVQVPPRPGVSPLRKRRDSRVSAARVFASLFGLRSPHPERPKMVDKSFTVLAAESS
jgi:hypothetical protein